MKEHGILFSAPMVQALLNTEIGSWPPEPIDPAKPCKGVTRRLSKQWLKVKAGDRLWVRESCLYKSECGEYYCRFLDNGLSHAEAWTCDGGAHWLNDDRIKTWDDAKVPRYPLEYAVGGYSAQMTGQKKGSFTLHLLRCDTSKIIEPYTGNTIIETRDVVFRRRVPSIHMPRWASRILLEALEDAREERLQNLTEDEAVLEGVQPWRFNPDQSLTSGERSGDSLLRSGFAYLWDETHDKDGLLWYHNPEVVRVGPFRRLS